MVGAPKALVQVFDYVPEGGGGGRQFPISKGIIGMTFHEKSANVDNFHTDDEYRRQMLDRYNYTTGELGRRRADRRSYLCYPILDDTSHEVIGLLYFDSCDPDTFSMNSGDPIWELISRAAQTIRSHLV